MGAIYKVKSCNTKRRPITTQNDFANNRVGIYVTSKAGWGFASLRVLSVEGLVKNT